MYHLTAFEWPLMYCAKLVRISTEGNRILILTGIHGPQSKR